MADDKLKRAARALAKKDVASSEWMWNPVYHKADPQPTWLDKFLHTAPPAPVGPPAEYKRPMWMYDTEGEKKDVKPFTQWSAEQQGLSRQDVIDESRRAGQLATPMEERADYPDLTFPESRPTEEDTTGKAPYGYDPKAEEKADYEQT